MEQVWYAAYGSNLSAARFSNYLTGGRPEGAAREYPGSRDHSAPLADRSITLPGQVYFAWQSPTWGGGIAFYDPHGGGTSAGRAWLVTGSQFSDVASQEMHRPTGRDLPLTELFEQSSTALLGPGRYETLHLIGWRDDVPVVTFTASWAHREVSLNAPSGTYLRTMATGLAEAHGWDASTICDYLVQRPGVRPTWNESTLLREISKNS